MVVLAGTGHRFQRLPCRTAEYHPWAIAAKRKIKEYLEQAKPDYVVSGCASGFDTWLAEAALDCGFKLIAYPINKHHGFRWEEPHRSRMLSILEKAHEIRYGCSTGQRPEPVDYFHRDCAMVDLISPDSVLLALWDGDKYGGTYNTVAYAERQQKSIVNLWF